MIRLWAGWFTATLDAAYAGKGPLPQLIVLDCKGGPDARAKPPGPAGCSTAPAPAASRSGPTKPACPCGICRPAT